MNRQQLIEQLRELNPNASDDALGRIADTILRNNRGDDNRGGRLGERARSAAVSATQTAAGAIQELAEAQTRLSEILSPLQAITQQIRLLRDENENLFKAGYSDSMFDFTESMEAASRESYRLTGNMRAFTETQTAMRQGFQGLGFVSKDFRKSLMETGTALSAAGFDMRDFSEIVDSATFAFNKSEGQIKDISATLIKTSRDFAIAPRELTENFRMAQQNFAYSSGKFMDNFLKLQKMSRTTGLAFRKLATSFGDSMDTFEGSASKAGQLNQILGKSMFNSIDLLNKTEAERAETIKKGILERFGNRVNDLQKFELKAIASSLNMSVEDARRFLRGEPPKAAKDLKKLEEKDPVKMASANLGNELDLLSEGINSFRMVTERTILEMSQGGYSAARAMIPGGEEGRSIFRAIQGSSAGLVNAHQKTFGDAKFTKDSPLLSMNNAQKLMTLITMRMTPGGALGQGTYLGTVAAAANQDVGTAIGTAGKLLYDKFFGMFNEGKEPPPTDSSGQPLPRYIETGTPRTPKPKRPPSPSASVQTSSATISANSAIVNLTINGVDLGKLKGKMSGAPVGAASPNPGGR